MGEKKTKLTGVIPEGILKKCVDSYISMLAKKRINSLERERFPDQLKLDDFTKKCEWNKENHQPVSALSYTYKIFFRILFWYP